MVRVATSTSSLRAWSSSAAQLLAPGPLQHHRPESSDIRHTTTPQEAESHQNELLSCYVLT